VPYDAYRQCHFRFYLLVTSRAIAALAREANGSDCEHHRSQTQSIEKSEIVVKVCNHLKKVSGFSKEGIDWFRDLQFSGSDSIASLVSAVSALDLIDK